MQVPWDWTVGDLKNKLMREYEGRPEAEEQKLIFSGKVLQNAQVLRDVVTVPSREEGDEEKENEEKSFSSVIPLSHHWHFICMNKLWKISFARTKSGQFHLLEQSLENMSH